MKRTRRAALAAIAGSSSLLAFETFGYSSVEAERGVGIEIADDADAFLGLHEGMDNDGVLFDGPRSAPVTFDVVNQLTEPLSVRIETETFRFEEAEGADLVETGVVSVGETDGARLDPGERVAGITVTVDQAGDSASTGETVTGSISFTAEGDSTAIDVERQLTLERPAVTVESASLGMFRAGGDGFGHKWTLQYVDTGGLELDGLALDYSGTATSEAMDLAGASNLDGSLAVDDTDHAVEIDAIGPTELDVNLTDSVTIDGATIVLDLIATGPPASPGGGAGNPSGATATLYCGAASTTVEAIWENE